MVTENEKRISLFSGFKRFILYRLYFERKSSDYILFLIYPQCKIRNCILIDKLALKNRSKVTVMSNDRYSFIKPSSIISHADMIT